MEAEAAPPAQVQVGCDGIGIALEQAEDEAQLAGDAWLTASLLPDHQLLPSFQACLHPLPSLQFAPDK